jgi:hypothetical protein
MKKHNFILTIFFFVLLRAGLAKNAYAVDLSGVFMNAMTIFVTMLITGGLLFFALYHFYKSSREKNEKKEGERINFPFFIDLFARTENLFAIVFLVGLTLPLTRLGEGFLSSPTMYFINTLFFILIITLPVILVISHMSLKAVRGYIEFRDADMVGKGKNILMMIIEDSITENIVLTIVYLSFLLITGIAAWVLALIYL